MKYLYIDTSSNYLYSAIVEYEKIVSEVKKEFGHTMSVEALPEISMMFQLKDLKTVDIDKIIVVNGPGSFTGIRIGITLAKVLAWTLHIPITTITSLEAMAISHNNVDVIKVPIINARRGYVYAAIFDKDFNTLLEPQHIKLEELLEKLSTEKKYNIITNDAFNLKEPTFSYDPDFVKIVNHFKDKQPINPHIINPDYLKLTEAEENA